MILKCKYDDDNITIRGVFSFDLLLDGLLRNLGFVVFRRMYGNSRHILLPGQNRF